MEQRLHKSTKEKMIWGVCGGLAEYFEIDPVLVRVVFVVLGLASGAGIIAYVILAIVMPEAPTTEDPLVSGMPRDPVSSPGASATNPQKVHEATHGRRRQAAGWMLVAVGAVLLASNFGIFFWWRWDLFWPVAIIAVGVFIIAGRQLRGGR